MTVSVAPATPVAAAKIADITTAPTASPPGRRRVHRWIASNSLSARPDRSSSAPMKTKSGIAPST